MWQGLYAVHMSHVSLYVLCILTSLTIIAILITVTSKFRISYKVKILRSVKSNGSAKGYNLHLQFNIENLKPDNTRRSREKKLFGSMQVVANNRFVRNQISNKCIKALLNSSKIYQLARALRMILSNHNDWQFILNRCKRSQRACMWVGFCDE